MSDDSDLPRPTRRDLLAAAGAFAMAGMSGQASAQVPDHPAPHRPAPLPRGEGKPLVAIQIGGRSFVDEGVERCLDTLQATAGINTIMAAVFTYGGGLAGRQGRSQPLPDHGVQEYDQVHGGSYAAIHPEFYEGSVIRDIRAPELGSFDILGDVIPAAKARGMKTYALFEENYNPRLIPNFEKIAEVDLFGRVGRSSCFNNPNFRSFIASMVADWVSSNDIDGLMWESERQGPFNSALGIHFGDAALRRSNIACFCEHCTSKARELGIDARRAREGYLALDGWVKRVLAAPRGADGAFVPFWRILLDYPEILAWHRFWGASQEEAYGLIYGTAKRIRPTIQVGWHIMHLVTMSPFYQADVDYARLLPFADFLKPCPYNNCAGPRLAEYVRNTQATLFRDMTPEQVLDMTYRMMGLTGEASLDKLPTAGLSANSVAVETRRAIADVGGAVPIYPGIDIDIPTGRDQKRTRPQDVKAATGAALDAGAAGVILSRKYAEMRLTNLAGAGAALRERHLI
ncbi:hypothetical protein [Sphingobium aquiterrae]|uniref:hypothetical protein n=1 Tax=Sphingobium aquiterrae TaxID=2038656 RepID=UPI003015990A